MFPHKYTEQLDGKTEIKATCIQCNKNHTIVVRTEDMKRYDEGTLMQDAFPYLDVDARELLISGICDECFDALTDD